MKNRKFWIALALVCLAGVAMAAEAAEPPYPNFGLPRTEEMMFLALQIGVVLIAAKLGGMLAAAIGLPSILGELAAGIVIGPWALGGIGFGSGMFAEGLFHGGALRHLALPVAQGGAGYSYAATTPELYGFASIASVILLFLSGLETNLKMFLKYSFVGTLVGLGGVIASFFFGDICAVAFLPMFFPHFAHLHTLPFAQAMMDAAPLYMGIMSTATSVGITARILSEKKKMDSEEGTTIMAGAVIDDVLGLIVLAIGNGIIMANMKAAAAGGASAGVDWGAIGMVALKAFGVWLSATVVGVCLARLVAKILKVSFKDPIVISMMAFGLAMILAGFFESMGLAMIIGAYVMGLSLSRTDLKHTIQESLTPVYTFLVPIFFCVMGMMVDITQLCSKPVLIFGLIYTVLAILAKVLGCMIPSLFCGFNILGGLRIGAGMVPRGEVALIIAGIGLSAGILTPEIFGIGIMMTLLTTVVAPPALVALFVPKKPGVYHPKAHKASREICFEMASAQVADYILTKLVSEFRSEGFYTSLLSTEEHIWEIVMDDMEISIRRQQNRILVQCTQAEEAILMSAWMEVASQVSDLAKSIAKPMRSDTMDQLLKDTSVNGSAKQARSLGVARYLQGFTMLPHFKAATKEEAFRKIIDAIAKEAPNHVKDPAAALASVARREASMPTGLDHGIAVPHGRDASISSIAGAVALVDPVDENGNNCLADYETIDKSPVRIIVLTLANSEAQTPYLQLMSAISRILRADDGYRKLAQCETASEMRRFFRGA